MLKSVLRNTAVAVVQPMTSTPRSERTTFVPAATRARGSQIVDHDDRRRELGVALLRVLARDGIEAVSVRTVAAEAGWTRGVIAHYFSDRDELLL